MDTKPITFPEWRNFLDDMANEGYLTGAEYVSILNRIRKIHGYM